MNKEICLKIYEENKDCIYWYLKKKCTWLSDDDVHDIMFAVWLELSSNIQEVYNLSNKTMQSAWLLSVTHRQALHYKKGD